MYIYIDRHLLFVLLFVSLNPLFLNFFLWLTNYILIRFCSNIRNDIFEGKNYK